MLSCTYEVVAIDGDYAHLRRNDTEPEDNETKLVARALLPPEIMEGSILKYEMLQYEIIGCCCFSGRGVFSPALSWHLGNRAGGSCFERVAADVFV